MSGWAWPVRIVLAATLAMLPAAAAAVTRRALDTDMLLDGSLPAAIDYAAFAPPVDALPPSHVFEGRLRLRGQVASRVVVANRYYVGAADLSLARSLPRDFDYEFVQDGATLIPLRRGPIRSSHPWWEFVLEPGRAWDEPGDRGYTRAAIPFALQQKNANCTHNGVLTFLFRGDGAVSQVALQVASETCLYLQLDLWGLLAARYEPGAVAGKAAAIAAHADEVAHRLPVKPLAALATDAAGVDPAAFTIGAASARTLHGVVANGIHYVSGCATRQGEYPYCEVLDLPSFSIAKSAFAAVALMRLEALQPGTRDQAVSRHLAMARCRNANWDGVTLLNLLDMASGNFHSPDYMVDEDAPGTAGFFVPTDHAHKLRYACGTYARRVPPGSRWVYHTSDTYLLGSALNGSLRALPGRARDDVYTDLVVADVFKPLRLSPVTHDTRRTYDAAAQPFTGWGLTLHRDDLVRIARFLSIDRGRIDGVAVLDPTLLDEAMQRVPQRRGLQAAHLEHFRYQHGVWARDVAPALGCAEPTWVPFMSGFGGITVVMFPNGVTYYNVADDGALASIDWTAPAHAADRIDALCQRNASPSNAPIPGRKK